MPDLIITNALIFDGHGADLQGEADILVREGRIETIDKNLTTAAARVIDARGRVVMPGLIDAHFHACAPLIDVAAADHMPESLLAQYARANLEGALLRGFTTVRDAGGADFGLAQAIERGLIQGPRLLFAGKALSQTGGHGDLRSPHDAPLCACAYCGSLTQVVDGVDALRLATRETLRRGASHIKLMLSGGVLSEADPIWSAQYSDEEILAVVGEATARRAYVMAHAHTGEAALRCLRLGVRSIEHGALIDAATAQALAGQEIYVVPTLAIIDALLNGPTDLLPGPARAKLATIASHAQEAVAACAAAGVKLGFGTDLVGELHPRQNREFVLRGQVQSPLEVLRSATSVNAALLQRTGDLGEVRRGAYADLLIVDGDPLRNLDLLARPHETLMGIISRGEVIRDRLTA
ncbi:MAG: amidohydrolase family protein [Caulobacteraceae bacterium]|nr:amidohydrolase family protein [Caulobacteraceae bacterium]